ncbi:MAG: ComF family protein [Phormidesmis sp.]
MLNTWQFGKARFHDLVGLFLHRPCPVCDRPSPQVFCTDCRRQVLKPSPLLTGGLSATALPITALGLYGGALRQAIRAMKYSNRPEIGTPLGAALAERWLREQASPPRLQMGVRPSGDAPILYVLPIPLHKKRARSRGFNQAECIARAFAQVSGLPLLPHGLERVQATLPQHELGLKARQENLNEAFRVGRSLQKIICKAQQSQRAKPAVLLIDDIYTTGATAQSAVDTLARSGASVVGMAAVARAMR